MTDKQPNVASYTDYGVKERAYNVRSEARIRIRVEGFCPPPPEKVMTSSGVEMNITFPHRSPMSQMIGEALVQLTEENPAAEVEVYERDLAGIEAMVEHDLEAVASAERRTVEVLKQALLKDRGIDPSTLPESLKDWPADILAGRPHVNKPISCATTFRFREDREPGVLKSVKVLGPATNPGPTTDEERHAQRVAREMAAANPGIDVAGLADAIGKAMAKALKGAK